MGKATDAAAKKPPENFFSELASQFARLSEIYHTESGLDLADLVPALAMMVVELVQLPISYPAPDPDMSRRQLIRLRAALDQLYPSSVWPDNTTQIGGRFAWALRKEIADRLQDLE